MRRELRLGPAYDEGKFLVTKVKDNIEKLRVFEKGVGDDKAVYDEGKEEIGEQKRQHLFSHEVRISAVSSR